MFARIHIFLGRSNLDVIHGCVRKGGQIDRVPLSRLLYTSPFTSSPLSPSISSDQRSWPPGPHSLHVPSFEESGGDMDGEKIFRTGRNQEQLSPFIPGNIQVAGVSSAV